MKRLFCVALLLTGIAKALDPLGGLQVGEGLPPGLDSLYRSGLRFLADTQTPQGYWNDAYGRHPGVVGFAVMAFLASGEDPNFGPYRTQIRRAAEYIISQQDPDTGYIGNSMYNHAFATLALAELYGHLHEPDAGRPLRNAVDLILLAQAQNPQGAWRYTPISQDADTTVSGAQLVTLFAARNAGLAVPETAIEKGMQYFRDTMDPQGGIGYTTASGGNATRSAIASLNFSLFNDFDSPESRTILDYTRRNRDASSSYVFYHLYYMAQALFQGDMSEWRLWNSRMLTLFEGTQQPDGSWNGPRGPAFSTSAALLTLALNYRLMPIYER